MKNKPQVSLTRLLRRRLDINHIKYILNNHDVQPFVGGLPPQLCPRVASDLRGVAAYEMHWIISEFLENNLCYLTAPESDVVVDVDAMKRLFGTDCKLTARGINICGLSPWSGLMAVVFKLSFPKIGAEYALKSFYDMSHHYRGHGPVFEIQTAFAAGHAEPRDNCPVYMASFTGTQKYMLSKWAGERQDGIIRHNENDIFAMRENEAERRNYRHGRRIDFGDTYLTSYGALSYRGRKMFRTIMNAAERGYMSQIDYLYTINMRPAQRRELDHVIDLAVWTCVLDDKYRMADLIETCVKRQR
ncbi:MAG: hypothetical protein NC311_05425 [Muribaculaceae bacterium]|nr:hypothetical protein [Muribaculaceae bacterium]